MASTGKIFPRNLTARAAYQVVGNPDSTRPVALPTAPTVSANAATAAEWPAARANGTSWLITIVPAVVPRQYAIHNAQNVCVRTMSRA